MKIEKVITKYGKTGFERRDKHGDSCDIKSDLDSSIPDISLISSQTFTLKTMLGYSETSVEECQYAEVQVG